MSAWRTAAGEEGVGGVRERESAKEGVREVEVVEGEDGCGVGEEERVGVSLRPVDGS